MGLSYERNASHLCYLLPYLHQPCLVFLSKLFMGSIYKEINEKAKNCFRKVIKYKPLSSKKESKEIYIFCKDVLKI